ncbi:MAG: DinB family protein [Acidimicrobiales bacterium]
MDVCDECGFDFDKIRLDEIAPRMNAGVAQLVAELHASADPAHPIPALPPGRWSTLEYGAHVRDVMLTIRDRMVIGLVEDRADFKPMYRDERITLGLYRTDTVDAVSWELEVSAAMLLRLLAAIEIDQLARLVRYGHPNPTDRSILWMAKQAVHELEHHLSDTRENAQL